MRRKGFFMTVAAWTALAATGAHAQIASQGQRNAAKECLTPEEAGGVIGLIVPSAIRGVRDACGPHLPAIAYLKTNGDRLAARFEAQNSKPSPATARAISKLSGMPDMPFSDMMVAMFTSFMQPMVAEEAKALKPQDCAKVDRVVALLDPLPADNLVELTVIMVEVGLKEEKEPPFTICASQG